MDEQRLVLFLALPLAGQNLREALIRAGLRWQCAGGMPGSMYVTGTCSLSCLPVLRVNLRRAVSVGGLRMAIYKDAARCYGWAVAVASVDAVRVLALPLAGQPLGLGVG